MCIAACGQPSPVKVGRVVGGVNAVEGEWPWQVSLHFSGYLYCGASVVSSDWLVSAAHCFSKDRLSDPGQWSAHLGMLSQGSARHVGEIRRIVVHEYYSASTFDYDVALLQLRRPWPASLSPFIQPVCLPAPMQTVTRAHRCWVTGWGYRSEDDKTLPTVLQKAEVFVLDQSECKRKYSPITPRMLCAGVPSGEQDACRRPGTHLAPQPSPRLRLTEVTRVSAVSLWWMEEVGSGPPVHHCYPCSGSPFLHISAPSVFYLGGSVEFVNMSFSLELADLPRRISTSGSGCKPLRKVLWST
ncbi:hypothetical protein DPEC_G00380110 [Dallia pectoralis]|nr:hypothetical protein DPEC_G00380110 [Dallia pectoralis]